MYKHFKQFVYKQLIPFIRIWKKLKWYIYLITHNRIQIVVGAGPTNYKGWFSTDIVTLDLTNENDFKKYFTNKKIYKILAEHVLEHLSEKDLKLMLSNFFKYSSEDVIIRIAVPDGFHKDADYINSVRPGGTGIGADDHKNLFNYKSLSKLFEDFNFRSQPIEYWDENGNFHQGYINDENGFIKRSFINDSRNADGNPHYTSLIIDFHKFQE